MNTNQTIDSLEGGIYFFTLYTFISFVYTHTQLGQYRAKVTLQYCEE